MDDGERWSMLNIVLFGPRAGKGTQAQRMMDATGLPRFQRAICRAAVKAETSVGLEAKKYMDAGALVPDQVIIDLIKDRMKEDDAQDGVMFDGFLAPFLRQKHLLKSSMFRLFLQSMFQTNVL